MTDILTGSPNTFSNPISSISDPTSSVYVPTTPPENKGGSGMMIPLILVLIVLALLGLNVFAYLAKGTDYLSHIVEMVTGNTPAKAESILTTSARGVKLATGVVGGAIEDAGNVLERELNLKRDQLWSTRDKGIKKATEKRQIPGVNRYPQYEPDETDSKIQKSQKPGFCYIGTDRGYRSCIAVSQSDKCMSGKIFPTQRLCMNPALRQ